jgi:chromosomal replication initiator protein
MFTNAELKSIWDVCLEEMRHIVPGGQVSIWIEPLRFMEVREGVLYLGAANSFTIDYISRHYEALIVETIRKLDPTICSVQFVAASEQDPPVPSIRLAEEEVKTEEKNWKVSIQQLSKQDAQRAIDQAKLNSRYTFAEYVVGSCNEIAHTAARTAAQAPGSNNFNPLIIYGGTGLGKTHLLQAIGNFALENHTAQRVVYRNSDQFMKEFFDFLEKKRQPAAFYEIYRHTDILLLDDIQFLARGDKMQDSFYQIFRTLLSLKKQIVITCDQKPSEVRGLHNRLLNNFETGLQVDIKVPERDDRLAILHHKVLTDTQFGYFPEEVIEYVASRYTANVRELEGTLVKLFAYSSIFHQSITLDIAKQILDDTVRNTKKKISVQSIMELTEREFQLKSDLLASRTQLKSVSLPRKVAMFLAKELTDNSMSTIGLHFNRDHSTVICSIKSVTKLIDSDAELGLKVSRMREILLTD